MNTFEERIAQTPHLGPGGTPMPCTAHPFYADRQEWVRDWLDNGNGDYLEVPLPPRMSLHIPDLFAEPERVTLARRQCWAHAPYVGRPYMLTWFAAVDRFGRGIAGSPRIEFVQ